LRLFGHSGRRRPRDSIARRNLEHGRRRLTPGALAVTGLLPKGSGGLGEDRHLQARAGPDLRNGRGFGALRHTGSLRHARRLWHGGSLRHAGGLRRPWGLGHARRLRCPRRLKHESLALHFVALDQGLAQVLNLHWTGRRSRYAGNGNGRQSGRSERRRGEHWRGERAGHHGRMIEDDGVVRGGVGDHGHGAGIHPRFPVTRAKHLRCGLLRSGSGLGQLRDRRAIGATGGQGRWR